MTLEAENRRSQFSLRSLLFGLVWLSLLMAICVHYQRAADRHQRALEAINETQAARDRFLTGTAQAIAEETNTIQVAEPAAPTR